MNAPFAFLQLLLHHLAMIVHCLGLVIFRRLLVQERVCVFVLHDSVGVADAEDSRAHCLLFVFRRGVDNATFVKDYDCIVMPG